MRKFRFLKHNLKDSCKAVLFHIIKKEHPLNNYYTQLLKEPDNPLRAYELIFTNNDGIVTEKYIRLVHDEHEIKSEADELNIKDPFVHTGAWSYKPIITAHSQISHERTN